MSKSKQSTFSLLMQIIRILLVVDIHTYIPWREDVRQIPAFFCISFHVLVSFSFNSGRTRHFVKFNMAAICFLLLYFLSLPPTRKRKQVISSCVQRETTQILQKTRAVLNFDRYEKGTFECMASLK